MNRLFTRTLAVALAALTAMTVILVLSFSLGYRRSISQWGASKQEEAALIARALLEGSADGDSVRISDDTPLFVYSSDQELLYSNRGSGRRWITEDQSELSEVIDGDRLLGYFHLGSVQFQENEANAAFISSMGTFIAIGLSFAIVISVVISLFFSRSLSAPTVTLVGGLNKIGSGDLSIRVPERGADEIASIARSVNMLAVRLGDEQESRRQWIHDITHDLRTPVSAMKAQFEGMADGVLTLDRDRIRKNLSEIERIESLVENLEELMKLESPELVLSIVRIDLKPFVEEVIERFSLDLRAKNVSVEICINAVSIHADRDLLFRAMSNVVGNAVRHVHENGKVRITADSVPGNVELSVTNSGEHLSDQDQRKAFRRLYRGEYARNTKGSGLGLTITSRICALHGGAATLTNVGAQDEEERGVKVVLSIPTE